MSLNYYPPEKREALVKEEAAACREAAAVFPFVRDTIRAFDGKVYNCRFEKALQAALAGKAPGRIYTRKNEYSLTLEYYPAARCVRGYNFFDIASLKMEEMPDGKRIDATKLDESLKSYRVNLLQKAARIEEQAEKAEIYREQIKTAVKLIDQIVGDIDSTIRDIYDLDYYIRRH